MLFSQISQFTLLLHVVIPGNVTVEPPFSGCQSIVAMKFYRKSQVTPLPHGVITQQKSRV